MDGGYYFQNRRKCNAQHYPPYVEFEDGAQVKMKGYFSEEVPYFHVSVDTFFTVELLEEVNQDLTVLMANFISCTEKMKNGSDIDAANLSLALLWLMVIASIFW